jgi:hypothetical protein
MAWTYRPDDLAAALEAAGFDVDRSRAALADGGGSLLARRERADRAILVVVDAGGRLRIDLTTRIGDASGQASLGGLSLRETEETTRTRTLTGRLSDPADLERVLADLVRPAAGPAAGSTPPPPNEGPPRGGPW